MFKLKFFFGVIKIIKYSTFNYDRGRFRVKLYAVVKMNKRYKLISIIFKTKKLKAFLDLKNQIYTYILINGHILLKRLKKKKGKKMYLSIYKFYPIKIEK